MNIILSLGFDQMVPGAGGNKNCQGHLGRCWMESLPHKANEPLVEGFPISPFVGSYCRAMLVSM